MAVIPVERKPLTFAERTYLPQIYGGLKITLKHFFAPKDTLEYPEQRPAIPAEPLPQLLGSKHGTHRRSELRGRVRQE